MGCRSWRRGRLTPVRRSRGSRGSHMASSDGNWTGRSESDEECQRSLREATRFSNKHETTTRIEKLQASSDENRGG